MGAEKEKRERGEEKEKKEGHNRPRPALPAERLTTDIARFPGAVGTDGRSGKRKKKREKRGKLVTSSPSRLRVGRSDADRLLAGFKATRASAQHRLGGGGGEREEEKGERSRRHESLRLRLEKPALKPSAFPKRLPHAGNARDSRNYPSGRSATSNFPLPMNYIMIATG